MIVAGPDVGISWPALFEHKSLNAKSWADLVKRGVELSKPIYYAQLQIYMAYMDLATALFTAVNKDTQALHHEVVSFDARAAQALSDKAVDIIRAAEAGELPPRIAENPDFHLCRWCFFATALLEGGRRMTFTPSPQQAAAIAKIVDWYRNPHRKQPVFRLFGYAGSGKSTITAHAIEALGLVPKNRDGIVPGGVLFAAYHRQGRAGDDAQGHAGLDHP